MNTASVRSPSGICVAGRSAPADSRGGLLMVDDDPDAATVVWVPGSNSTLCRWVRSQLTQPVARRLAAAVRRSPALRLNGLVNCPLDDGTAATVYLQYAGQRRAEVLTVALTGCRMLVAPGRAPRQVTGDVLAQLQPTPADWNPQGSATRPGNRP